jgi:hypothetical protein
VVKRFEVLLPGKHVPRNGRACPVSGIQRFTFGLTFLGWVAWSYYHWLLRYPEIIDLAVRAQALQRSGGKLGGIMED